jgi:hypothetical protein
MNKRLVMVGVAGFWAFAALNAVCGEIRLGSQSTVSFASVSRAQQILTNRDEFIRALSPFDRWARTKTDRAPSEEVFVQFLRTNALAWEPTETNRFASLLSSLAAKLKRWDLLLPATIELVKTTGQEEGHAAYTRQNAIILSKREISSAGTDLLAHELFHVLSRHDPQLRKALYGVIGFHSINEVELPPSLVKLKITNPDGVHNNFMIEVRHRAESVSVVPILYSSSPVYNPARGGEFFDYLVFKLMALEKTAAGYEPRQTGGKVQLLDPAEVSEFFEQIGRNTQYIIHPDEILADNFVLLVNGRTNLATPKIVLEMDRVLVSAHRLTPARR